MKKLRLLAAAVLLTLTAGCAQTPAKSDIARGPIDDAAVNAIYAELDAAVARAEEALEQRGDASAATKLTLARDALTAAGARCAALRGCDVERVIAAQDALIVRQSQLLLGEADVVPVDESATPGVGEAHSSATSPVVRAMPEAGRSVSMLRGKDLRTIIRLNEPVKAAIEEWLTWMRPNLLEAYENYQFMRHRMWPEYEKGGLPEALLFGILAKESGGKVHAVSRAGASGPLQFMPATGLRYGLNAHGGFDLRFDPTASTRANVAYLNDQFRLLNENLELALGAYNGGEGRMQRLSQGGQRGFWDASVFNRLPPETRDYVPMVMAAAWIFMHPEDYRVEFPRIDVQPTKVTLASQVSLNELAICMGQQGNPRGWFRTLRNLNPRWDANARIPSGTLLEMPKAAAVAYDQHCKPGSAMLAKAAELHDAAPPVAPPMRVAQAPARKRSHVVHRGETLSSIARKYGCGNVRSLAQANRLKAPAYPIRAGQRLVVPACA